MCVFVRVTDEVLCLVIELYALCYLNTFERYHGYSNFYLTHPGCK